MQHLTYSNLAQSLGHRSLYRAVLRHGLWLGVLLISSFSGLAQSVSSAKIEDASANRLTVTFSSAITLTDGGAGFRLVGGAARIKNLVSGSGTTTLTFALSDYALSNDAFKLVHWPELSNARGSSAKLAALNVSVTNNAASYHGSGKLYYVATSSPGNDTNTGLSSGAPFKTIGKAQTKAVAGDYILLKRGDTFNAFKITKGGNATAGPITYAAYGSTSTTQPSITGEVCTDCSDPRQNVAAILVHEPSYAAVNYLTIDNIRVINTRGGILVVSNSKDLVVSNCTVEGSGTGPKAGIELVNTAGRAETYENPRILNNTVSKCENSITLSGFSYDGMYEVLEESLRTTSRKRIAVSIPRTESPRTGPTSTGWLSGRTTFLATTMMVSICLPLPT